LGVPLCCAMIRAKTSASGYYPQTNSQFSLSSKLINFTQTINPNFKNQYSVSYREDNEKWNLIPLSAILDRQEYQEFIDRSELITNVWKIFCQYQDDWSRKNFENMSRYLTKEFYDEQRKIFWKNFGNNFDIIYEPRLIVAAPLNLEKQGDNYVFWFHISAKIVNFEISPNGYVISGKPYYRDITEYWQIKVDAQKKCYLMKIFQSSD
ncbi:MAG: hypothetical protein WBM32_04960, partial [Crocosphaera sp.]